jgi:hypothetical protein
LSDVANDNLRLANDNKRRYQREHMAWRRRHGKKTQRELLKDALELVAGLDPVDPRAQAFTAAVRDLLEPTPRTG